MTPCCSQAKIWAVELWSRDVFIRDGHPSARLDAGDKHTKLSVKALRAFQQAETAQVLIYVPAVAFWEIALLEKLGKIKLREGFAKWSAALLTKPGFAILPLETSIIAQAVGYNFNNDPFDSVIVANAAEIGVPLISKDVAITESSLVEIWW